MFRLILDCVMKCKGKCCSVLLFIFTCLHKGDIIQIFHRGGDTYMKMGLDVAS